MTEQELILLGLLHESPKHGYEIKKKIREILFLFAGVDLKSIYYPLGILEKKGYVHKRIGRQGKRPERYVYALTPLGETRFNELLSKSFLDFKRPQFSLDLSLYFLQYIPAHVSRRRLRARLQLLSGLCRSMRQMITAARKKGPRQLTYILEHNLSMVEAEATFLRGLINTLE